MKTSPLVGTVTRAATHPVSTTAFVAGVVRGAAASIIRTFAGNDDKADTKVRSELPHQALAVGPVTEAAPQRLPGPVGEPFTTEPSAVTRTSAHGGHGDDALIDDWEGDIEESPAAGSVVEALELGDGVGDLVDHDAIRAVVTESATLRRDAER
ncbi:MAG: hypothetical protein JWP74_3354 [Marmoricola sp.]|nr:hypothetical protein [Marmoricola sp.]